MITKTHHFLFLENSSWPIIISLNLFNLFFSLVLYLKFMFYHNFLFSFSILVFFSFIWWFNYSKELNLMGKMSKNMVESLKFSMILFISSEILFFFSFFWSYFHFFLCPELETSFNWPFFFLKSFNPLGIPLTNTFILLFSGITVTISHYYILKKTNFLAMIYLMVTIFLGLIFSILQWEEYMNSFFSISDGSFGCSFFMLTGFHGIHVMVGSMFILINLSYFYKFSFAKNTMTSFEMASWYWHFVDVVWIFLYFFLYYLNN